MAYFMAEPEVIEQAVDMHAESEMRSSASEESFELDFPTQT